jgi:hypothetical protein
MKTITATLLTMICAVMFTYAQEKVMKEMDAVKVSKSDVPDPLVQKAEKDFPGATPFAYYTAGETTLSNDWKVTENVDIKPGEKIDHYTVHMKGKGSEFEALYDASGKLIMSREVQKNVALPKPVLDAFGKSKYKGTALKKDKHYKMIEHGTKKEYYVVTLSDGKKLTFAPDGTILKE